MAVQEDLEALYEEASPEVGAGERREDVADLEIVEEEHHEVEVAFQAAAELQEVVALAEGEARLHEPCALFGLRIIQDTGQRGLISIRRRCGVTNTRARELRVAQLAGKSDPVLKFMLSITLSMPVRSTYLLRLCKGGFFACHDRSGPAKSSICRCKMTSPLVQSKRTKQLQDRATSPYTSLIPTHLFLYSLFFRFLSYCNPISIIRVSYQSHFS